VGGAAETAAADPHRTHSAGYHGIYGLRLPGTGKPR
jgi:hypothetical protein